MDDTSKKNLEELIELQRVNLKIGSFRERMDAIPAEIESLRSELAQCQDRLEHAKGRLEDQEGERRRGEGQVELLRDRLSKFKTQLMEVKDNKQYQAVLKEIAATESEISKSEDSILESMLAADERVADVKLATSEMEAKRKEVEAKCAELQADSDGIAEQVTQLEADRLRLLDSLDPALRDLYHRISAARSGTALAEARDQSCQVCHVKLRPQLFNEIKQNRRIIMCENCNRILYYLSP